MQTYLITVGHSDPLKYELVAHVSSINQWFEPKGLVKYSKYPNRTGHEDSQHINKLLSDQRLGFFLEILKK